MADKTPKRTPIDEPKPTRGKEIDLLPHATTALVTNLVVQPLRTGLNFAANHWHPFATIRAAWPHLYRGTVLNVARGTLAFTSQTYVQAWVHAHYGKETMKGKVGGVLASGVAGAVVAVCIETRFIRKNRGLAGTRFALPLAGYYFLRELGFSLFVLGSDGLTPEAKKVGNVGSIAATAWCHKKAVIQATMDGSVQTVTKALPYADPVTTLQRGTNLLAKAGYPANMFFFRGVLLKGYKKTYDTVREDVTPVIMKKLGR